MSVQGPPFFRMERYIGVWQCPNCGRVFQHELSNMMTYGIEGALMCTCHQLAQGCVPRMAVTRMQPLNDVAKQHEQGIRDAYERDMARQRADQESRDRAQAYADSWGYSTAVRRCP